MGELCGSKCATRVVSVEFINQVFAAFNEAALAPQPTLELIPICGVQVLDEVDAIAVELRVERGE